MTTSQVVKNLKARPYAYNPGNCSNELLHGSNHYAGKIPAFAKENFLTGNFLYVVNTFGERDGIRCAADFIDAYIDRRVKVGTGGQACYDSTGTLVGCYIALKNKNRINPVAVISCRATGRVVAVIDNGRGRDMTFAEVISEGMKAINGVAPQQVSDGCWVNPGKIHSGWIGVDKIKTNSYGQNNN